MTERQALDKMIDALEKIREYGFNLSAGQSSESRYIGKRLLSATKPAIAAYYKLPISNEAE